MAPFVCLIISFLFTLTIHRSFVISIAAVGGVAILNKLCDVTPPEPLTLPRINIKRHKETEESEQIGRRIPRL